MFDLRITASSATREGAEDACRVAAAELRLLTAHPENIFALMHKQEEVYVSVFIDNSNVFLGAQQKEGGDIDYQTRVSVQGLCAVVQQGRRMQPTRVMAGRQVVRGGVKLVVGSTPPKNERVWQSYRDEGYEVMLHGRQKGAGEQEMPDAMAIGMATSVISLCVEPHTIGELVL